MAVFRFGEFRAVFGQVDFAFDRIGCEGFGDFCRLLLQWLVIDCLFDRDFLGTAQAFDDGLRVPAPARKLFEGRLSVDADASFCRCDFSRCVSGGEGEFFCEFATELFVELCGGLIGRETGNVDSADCEVGGQLVRGVPRGSDVGGAGEQEDSAGDGRCDQPATLTLLGTLFACAAVGWLR